MKDYKQLYVIKMDRKAQLADIPRSTYYYWVNTFGMPDKDSELKDVIQA
ncbi:MAG: hypothetical protein ACQEXX_22530 [Bacillota bacterium]